MSKRLSGIAVVGYGTVAVQPDLAIVQLGAMAEASNAAAASERAAAAMQAMVDAAAAAGVEERDRLTGTLRLSSWRHDMAQPPRFSAQHELTLKVRAVAQAGAIVQAVLAAGGDAAEAHDLRLAVEHPQAHLDQARADAMADARRKAEQLAELAGRQLGVVTAVSEDAGGGIQHKVYAMEARSMAMADASAGGGVAGSPPVEAGDLRLHAQVHVEFAWDD